MRILGALAVVLLAGCFVPPDDGCGDGFPCGQVCCPDDRFRCFSGECRLTSCDSGFQLCGGGCIPLTANCCDASGDYCQTGTVCCGDGCIPVGTSCCGNNTFCPAGSVCCNGNQCCN